MPVVLLTLRFFQPPLPSMRPHVIGYNVSHNASGTVQMYETTDTYFLVESASPNLFVFTVTAFNVLGTGEESGIISELYSYYNTILFSIP